MDVFRIVNWEKHFENSRSRQTNGRGTDRPLAARGYRGALRLEELPQGIEDDMIHPERKCTVNSKDIAEYWWAGKMVVYVDHHSTEQTYEEAVAEAENIGAPTEGEEI